MTAPKQLSKRSTQIRSVAPRGRPPILTHSELALLTAHRAMDDETRDDAVEMMQILARKFPRAARLRLIARGVA